MVVSSCLTQAAHSWCSYGCVLLAIRIQLQHEPCISGLRDSKWCEAAVVGARACLLAVVRRRNGAASAFSGVVMGHGMRGSLSRPQRAAAEARPRQACADMRCRRNHVGKRHSTGLRRQARLPCERGLDRRGSFCFSRLQYWRGSCGAREQSLHRCALFHSAGHQPRGFRDHLCSSENWASRAYAPRNENHTSTLS